MEITEDGSATSRGLARPHPASARAEEMPQSTNARARVSKDEGERGLRHFRPTEATVARAEEPTCGCGKRSPAPFHCFRIVIYNGWRNSNVSSGRQCSAAHRWAVSSAARIDVMAGGRGGGRGRETRTAPTSRWPAYRGEAIMRGPRAPARHVDITRDEPWASEEVE